MVTRIITLVLTLFTLISCHEKSTINSKMVTEKEVNITFECGYSEVNELN